MLEDLRYLLDYANRYKDQAFLEALSNHFCKLEHSRYQECPPFGIQKAIIQKLSYILLRFSYWSHSALFRDSVLDYFIQDFSVTRESLGLLINSSFGLAQNYFAEYKDICGNDKEFIRYFFVECATQQNELNLERNFGIGGYLIAKIKKAVDVASAIHQSETTAPLLFLPELDSMVSDILYEMQVECLANPQKIALFRLKYALLDNVFFKEFINDFGIIECIFDMLLRLGCRPGLSYSSFVKALAKKLSKSQLDHKAQEQCGGELIPCGLVYLAAGASKNSEICLSSKAQEITAESFVTLTTAQKMPSDSDICQWPVPYQSIFFSSDSLDVDYLQHLILNCRPLSPQVLELALKNLQKRMATEAFLKVLDLLKIQEKSPFLQKIRCRFEQSLSHLMVDIDQTPPIMPKFEQLFAGQEAS